MPKTNWARNIEYRASDFVAPTCIEQLQDVVTSTRKVRATGTGHSFNRIADTTGVLVSTRSLTTPVQIDEDARTVTVAAGATYGEVCAELDSNGWALHNLGSLPHLSVGGACATSTHGSGNGNGSLATAVRAIEFVRADGEIISFDQDHPSFPGAVVSLGALGVVTRLTLAIEAAYEVRQDVYLDMPLGIAAEHAQELLAAAYSVSMFSNFIRPDVLDAVWLKARVDPTTAEPPTSMLGAQMARSPRHPIPGLDPAAATEQLGRVGRWHQRLPHFRPEFTPSSGDELQSEFFLPRAAASDALLALRSVAARFSPALQVLEMRTIAADDLWLSPCYRRDSLGLHFTWRPDTDAVRPAVRIVQDALAPLEPRPHWGKVFLDYDRADFARIYPQLTDFGQLAATYDPERRFTNDFLEQYVLES